MTKIREIVGYSCVEEELLYPIEELYKIREK